MQNPKEQRNTYFILIISSNLTFQQVSQTGSKVSQRSLQEQLYKTFLLTLSFCTFKGQVSQQFQEHIWVWESLLYLWFVICLIMRRNYQNQSPIQNALNPEKCSQFKLFWSGRQKNTQNWASMNSIEASSQVGFNINPNASSCELHPIHRAISPQNSLVSSGRISPHRIALKRTPTLKSTAQIVRKYPQYQLSGFRSSVDSEIEKDLLRQTDCSQSSSESKSCSRKIQEYVVLKQLGKGRFGQVFLAIHKKTGFIGALKIIEKAAVLNIPREHQQKMIKQLINEIKIQAFLHHPNLIQLYDFFYDQHKIYLFMEAATDGHLFDILSRKGTLHEETTSIVTRQIIQGINYMHSKLIIHRDIKLENIVFTCGMAKICDFGWSIYEPKEFRSTICGTPLYLSPEILKGKKYNDKIDIWAIGTLAHQMATGQNPFGIKKHEELGKIVQKDFYMNTGSPQLKSFITFILRKQPGSRPTGEVLLKHPFITKYNDIETAEEICEVATTPAYRFS